MRLIWILLIGITFIGCGTFLHENNKEVYEEKDENGNLISQTITTTYYHRPANSHSRRTYKTIKYIYGKDGKTVVRMEKCVERPKKRVEKATFK